MPSIAPGQGRGEVAVHIREPGVRNMGLRIGLDAEFRVGQLVTAIEYHECRVIEVLRKIGNGNQRGMGHQDIGGLEQ